MPPPKMPDGLNHIKTHLRCETQADCACSESWGHLDESWGHLDCTSDVLAATPSSGSTMSMTDSTIPFFLDQIGWWIPNLWRSEYLPFLFNDHDHDVSILSFGTLICTARSKAGKRLTTLVILTKFKSEIVFNALWIFGMWRVTV